MYTALKLPGRMIWKQETIKNTSELQWNQEFECEFIGSTLTLIHHPNSER